MDPLCIHLKKLLKREEGVKEDEEEKDTRQLDLINLCDPPQDLLNRMLIRFPHSKFILQMGV